MTAPLEITLCRETGTALMCKAGWSERIPIADLPRKLRFYRSLWSRGSKVKGDPGPWAGHYEQDLRALVAAIREAGSDG